MTALPLVSDSDVQRTAISGRYGAFSYAQILYKARCLSSTLPDSAFCLLLCERRDLFIIAWLAALMRRQTVLLPPSRSDTVLGDMLQDYPDACCLVDDQTELSPDCCALAQDISWVMQETGADTAVPRLPPSHLAAVVFTSGSTGRPSANAKTWGELVAGSRLLQQRLQLDWQTSVVATVPAQHMYGLETSVLAPLLLGACVYSGKPFFPADVQSALHLMPSKPVLVSTPLHLRACALASMQWPPVAQVISATAPLHQPLAAEVEACLHTQVTEIFGCSEAGSFASRETARESVWHMYEGMRMRREAERLLIEGGHLPGPVSLADEVVLESPQQFRFLGRRQDLIKIAGKRISLAELNMRLNAIPGVEDGVFVQRASARNGVARLLALVVAPGQDVPLIRRRLAESIDPVFLPRPLVAVDALPRNAAHKLPQQALDELLLDLGLGEE